MHPKLVVAASLASIAGGASASDPVPAELVATVRQVHASAVRRHYHGLRTLMDKAFTWSFGGDGDAEQAIAEWRKDARYLSQLATVTRAHCEWMDRRLYQCPAKAARGFRAGFAQVDGLWKMVYFVEGD